MYEPPEFSHSDHIFSIDTYSYSVTIEYFKNVLIIFYDVKINNLFNNNI